MQETPRGRKKAILFTVLLHVILGSSLILGIEFSDYRPLSGPKVDIIKAELVTRPAPPAPPRVDPEAERLKREQETETRRRAAEAERERKAVEEKAAREREADKLAAREKVEAERKKKAETEALAAKQKAEEAENKKKAEAEAKRKAAAEAEAKRKAAAEAEAKRKAQAEQAAREKALQDALEQEQRERELDPLRDAYRAAIAQQISRNWLKPPGIGDELKCEVLAVQTPDGNITDARITRSSGNATFDESVIKAIYKAAPLPPPPRPEIFDRELVIGFCSTGQLC